MRCFFCNAFCAILILTTVAMAQADEQTASPEQLSVMIKASGNGGEQIGAGLIFGTAPGRVYVVTARHVLFREQQGASNVRVTLRGFPGETFTGEILTTDSRALDLAVLKVTADDDLSDHIESLRFDVFTPSTALKNGAQLIKLGNPEGKEWERTFEPDYVTRRGATELVVQSQTTTSGHSGGVMLNDKNRIVALIIYSLDQETFTTPIETVDQQLREWNYQPKWQFLHKVSENDESNPPVSIELCTMDIRSEPSGARVRVDDIGRGTTPLSVDVAANEDHDIELAMENYKDRKLNANCADSPIDERLERETAEIALRYTGDFGNCRLALNFVIGGISVTPRSNLHRVDNVPLVRSDYEATGTIGCPYQGVCQATGYGSIDIQANHVYDVVWSNTAWGQCEVRLRDGGRM